MLKILKDLFIKLTCGIKKNIFVFLIITFFSMSLIGKLFPLESFGLFCILGEKQEFVEPKFSIESFNNKTFQKEFEQKLGYTLFWNNLYIKNFNTIMFHVFNKSYSDDSSLIIGKDKYIFGKHYSTTYMSDLRYDEIEVEKMNETLKELRLLQDYLKRKNKLLMISIAPNKVKLYPEFLPYRYVKFNKHRRCDRDYNVFMGILKKNGLNYVSTRDYLDEISRKHEVFEKDDVVWSFYTVFVVAQKLVDKINVLSGANIEPLKTDKIIKHRTSSPTSLSAELLNIYVIPKNYDYEEVIPIKNKSTSKKKLAIIGGCSTDKLVMVLNSANVFSDIEHYSTNSMADGNVKYQSFHVKDSPKYSVSKNNKTVQKERFVEKLFNNDIILLDFNESFLLHKSLDTYLPEMMKYTEEHP